MGVVLVASESSPSAHIQGMIHGIDRGVPNETGFIPLSLLMVVLMMVIWEKHDIGNRNRRKT